MTVRIHRAARARARLAIFAVLVAMLLASASSSVVSAADPASWPSLLKPVDLIAYPTGTKPPAFSGETAAGRPLALTDLRGKVVVVNFWASWCAECRPEMPVLDRLYRELAAQGLTVVGINARESRQVVTRYGDALGLTFPLLVDPSGKHSDSYGVIGLPTTFLVSRDGRAVAFGVGPRDWGGRAARRLLDALLREPAPRTP